MAFRSEAKAFAKAFVGLILWAGIAFGATYTVRHRHLRGGAEGVLTIDDNAISFAEPRRGTKHSRAWKYDEIQQLTLGPDTLRVLTYEDNRRELARDRVYVFDKLPPAVAATWYPIFSRRLDARFVAALPDQTLKPEWQLSAKLIHGRTGSQGLLLVGTDAVEYRSSQSGESRTWRIADLQNVSSSDQFDLTITTRERQFRFQLQHPIRNGQYQELWMRVEKEHGLRILNFAAESKGTP